MPIIRNLVETWVCFACGRNSTFLGNPLEALEHFVDTERWRQLPTGEVSCDRCLLIPDVATLFLAAERTVTQ